MREGESRNGEQRGELEGSVLEREGRGGDLGREKGRKS